MKDLDNYKKQAAERAEELYPDILSNPAKDQCHHFGREGFERGHAYAIEQIGVDDIKKDRKRLSKKCLEYSTQIAKLREALEEAINGLQWRIDNQTDTTDKSDYVKVSEWMDLLNQTQ